MSDNDKINENKEQPVRINGKMPRGARVPMKVNKKTVGRVLGYLKPFTGQLILVVFCILLSSGASVM